MMTYQKRIDVSDQRLMKNLVTVEINDEFYFLVIYIYLLELWKIKSRDEASRPVNVWFLHVQYFRYIDILSSSVSPSIFQE